jgi:hypothetical protein
MDSEIEQYDNFVKYALNINELDFVRDFYDGKYDSYIQDKIYLMRTDFGSFWCGLDNKNKKKYVKLVKTYYEK